MRRPLHRFVVDPGAELDALERLLWLVDLPGSETTGPWWWPWYQVSRRWAV